jgi:hypothetical protein
MDSIAGHRPGDVIGTGPSKGKIPAASAGRRSIAMPAQGNALGLPGEKHPKPQTGRDASDKSRTRDFTFAHFPAA